MFKKARNYLAKLTDQRGILKLLEGSYLVTSLYASAGGFIGRK
jgi:hypothetical protein